jgi:hypothetical protein
VSVWKYGGTAVSWEHIDVGSMQNKPLVAPNMEDQDRDSRGVFVFLIVLQNGVKSKT